EKTFLVHKSLTSCASSYFNAAFRAGRFKEGDEGVVRLEEGSPSVVEHFLNWLCNGSLMWYDIKSDEKMKRLVAHRVTYELYVFAGSRDIPVLKNDMMDTVADCIARTWNGIPAASISLVYNNVPRGDPMTRLMV
ncbi:hypothetical protein B0J12DRAFT_535085, partial [Macrophomina phaseolina]